MPNPAALRERRLRKTKAQLIDEIDTLEQCTAALEATNRSGAPMPAKASEGYLTDQQLAHLARFSSENPNPVLRVMSDGTVLYANDAARAVKGLLKGRKKSALAGDLAGDCAEASGTAEVRETEFESGDRVFAFSIARVTGETYINIYGRDITERRQAEEALRLSEQRRAIVNLAATEGSYDWDITKDRLDVSQRLNEILGFEPSELTSKDWVARLHVDDFEIYRLSLVRHFKQDTSVLECEYRIRDKAGGERWISDRAIAQRDDQGRAVRLIGAILDISERKRADEEAQAARERFEEAIEAISSGFVLWDAEDRLVVCNSKYREYFPDLADMVSPGTLFRDLIQAAIERGLFPGVEKDPNAFLDATVEKRAGAKGDIREQHLAGDLWLQISDHRTKDGGIVSIYTDISELKTSEQDAQAARERFEEAIEAISSGFSLWDADDRLVVCNSRYRELYSEVADAVQPGVLVRDLVMLAAKRGMLPAAKDDPKAYAEEHLAKRAARVGQLREHRLSSGLWLQITDHRTADGGIVSIHTDVTELKTKQMEVEAQSAILELTLENMGQGITLVDGDLNTVAVNRKFLELQELPEERFGRGFAMEDALRYFAERGEYGPGDVEEQVRERLELSRKFLPHRFERTKPNGTVLEIAGNPIEGGGFVSTYTDITERKRAEEALREQTLIVELLHKTAADANEAEDAEAAIRACLEAVCAHTGWPVGHVYIRSPEVPDLLMPTDIWHLDQPERFAAFRKVTQKTTFESSVGLPGRVLASGKPAWIADVTKDPNFPRAKPAEEIGVRAGFAVPVLVGNRVEAVLEFFAATAVEPDEALMQALGNIGAQVGRAVERKRAEEELAEKEAQLRLALDNMPGGMMLLDRDLNFVLFNARYCELFEYPDGLVRVGGSLRDELRYQAERGDFGPGDKDDLIEQVVASFREDEAVSYERAIAGSGRTLQVYRAPMPDGGYVAIDTDITERKRAEEALLEAKRRSEEASKLVAEKNRMLESLSNQLSKYLSPQVYASIFSGEQSVEIASKRKKLTVFFSDIADFTGVTERLESEDLTNLLNHYLTEMSKIALDYGATIDKYVGDAIIAFFGDPETCGVKEDARTCVNMAIAMQRRMQELQSEWLDMGLEQPFQLRIGINTGFCTVGNFGSEDRMDYTIIGNEVNLAARLESLAEVGGILLAHETHALVKDTVLAEEGDTLTVKGFAKPVRTYSVAGLYDDLAEQGRIIRYDQEGLALKINRDKLTTKGKAEAIKALENAVAQLKG